MSSRSTIKRKTVRRPNVKEDTKVDRKSRSVAKSNISEQSVGKRTRSYDRSKKIETKEREEEKDQEKGQAEPIFVETEDVDSLFPQRKTVRIGRTNNNVACEQEQPKISDLADSKSKWTGSGRKRKASVLATCNPPTATGRNFPVVAIETDGQDPDAEILAALVKSDSECDQPEKSDDHSRPSKVTRLDYMVAANPMGKPRVVGAPKRNRKEQMTVSDQIRAGKDLAKSFGVLKQPLNPNDSDAMLSDTPIDDENNEGDTALPPLPDFICVEGNTSSSGGEQQQHDGDRNRRGQTRPSQKKQSEQNSSGERYRFMRSLREEDKQKRATYDSMKHFKEPRVHRQVNGDDDDGEHETNGNALTDSIVIKVTSSDTLKPYDYSSWDHTQPYDDEKFQEFTSDAQSLSDNAIKDYAKRITDQDANFTDEERLDMARAVFDDCGYGRAAITMEDFDVTRVRSDDFGATKHMLPCSGDATVHCRYPTSSNLRCRYDHHCFDGIPILMPLCYHEAKNILEVLPTAVFCSFPCMLAYVNREMPRMHSDVRADRVTLIHFMARKWFGITENLHMAPFIEQHCDYGGRLSTKQFRGLSQTHYSFVQYPLAVAVPARYVTEIFVSRKMDRAKRQGLNLRVSEDHGNQLPEMPLTFEIDPSAPAAPRGAEARSRANKAKAAREKKTGLVGRTAAAGGNKKRVTIAPDGTRKTIDRSYVENVIRKTAEQHKKNPKKRHALESMLGITSVTCEDFGNKTSNSSNNRSSTKDDED